MATAFASAGDQQLGYQACKASCVRSGCIDTPGSTAHCETVCRGHRPLSLRLLQWTCQDDCGYQCMTSLEQARREQGLHALKYHGKWPFVRIFGMQEIASVAFSFANLLAHAHNGWRYWRVCTPKQLQARDPYSSLWWAYLAVSCHAWVWSAAFHARDVRGTEVMDYVAADCVVALTLFAAVMRAFAITSVRVRAVAGCALAAGLALHLRYMLYVKFDYGWNMVLCIAAGLASSVTFLGGQMALFIVSANAAMLLELLDFPPIWGIFDAHSLWHAATVPLTYVWYSFVIRDHVFVSSSGLEKRRA